MKNKVAYLKFQTKGDWDVRQRGHACVRKREKKLKQKQKEKSFPHRSKASLAQNVEFTVCKWLCWGGGERRGR